MKWAADEEKNNRFSQLARLDDIWYATSYGKMTRVLQLYNYIGEEIETAAVFLDWLKIATVINNYTVTIISAQNTININPEAEIRKEMAGKG